MSRNICMKDGCTQMLRDMWDTLYMIEVGCVNAMFTNNESKILEFVQLNHGKFEHNSINWA